MKEEAGGMMGKGEKNDTVKLRTVAAARLMSLLPRPSENSLLLLTLAGSCMSLVPCPEEGDLRLRVRLAWFDWPPARFNSRNQDPTTIWQFKILAVVSMIATGFLLSIMSS